MQAILPPYSKSHIIVYGTLTLIMSVGLLTMLAEHSSVKKFPNSQSRVIEASAQELRQDFAEPLEQIAQGNQTNTWVEDKFVIIDVRPQSEFDEQHIAGAVNVPVANIAQSMFDPSVEMVVYSDDQQEINQALAELANHQIVSLRPLHEPLGLLEQNGYALASTNADYEVDVGDSNE